MRKKYPVGTNIRDISGWDRGTKAIFECKEHPGIHFMSKQPSCSNWFPANKAAQDIEFGITKEDPCPHKVRDDVWVLAAEYEAEDGAGL
jgi:hypothetical protein